MICIILFSVFVVPALPFNVFVFCVLFYNKMFLYHGKSLCVIAFITNVNII